MTVNPISQTTTAATLVGNSQVTERTNEWASRYLTTDDYQLASAVAGHEIKPDSNGHLGLAPAVLWDIAIARRSGEIPRGVNVPPSFVTSFHNTDPASDHRALDYIMTRDSVNKSQAARGAEGWTA